MTVALYMDVHVHRAITTGLRLRGVEVLTAQEDGYRQAGDDVLLDRATELQRVLFTQDEDLLAEAKRRRCRAPLLPVLFRRINFGLRLAVVCKTWSSLP